MTHKGIGRKLAKGNLLIAWQGGKLLVKEPPIRLSSGTIANGVLTHNDAIHLCQAFLVCLPTIAVRIGTIVMKLTHASDEPVIPLMLQGKPNLLTALVLVARADHVRVLGTHHHLVVVDIGAPHLGGATTVRKVLRREAFSGGLFFTPHVRHDGLFALYKS